MKIQDLKSNELIVMDQELYQEFCESGCVPTCHLNNTPIRIGDSFKMATIEKSESKGLSKTIDVMLSESATVEEFMKSKNKVKKKRKKGDGCFLVNGKIVTEL